MFNVEYLKKVIDYKEIIESSRSSSIIKIDQDSRLIEKGDCFFAIEGENFDGHNYIEDVVKKEASVIVADVKKKNKIIGDLQLYDKEELPTVIFVDNTVVALQNLAKIYLKKVNPKTIGVTGSTGKTTTRDMIFQVVNSKYKAHKNKENFNTVVGVPLTILAMPEDTEVIVLEMGMDSLGEIKTMVDIAPLDIGVITNIGISHMERLGSQDAIFQAKTELKYGLSKGSFMVASYKTPYLTKDKLRAVGVDCKLILTGYEEENDLQITNFHELEEGVKFNLRDGDKEEEFYLDVYGRHNTYNASLAVSCGLILDITLKEAKESLKKLELTSKRLTFKKVGNYTIIDDSYNASPDSVSAALEILKNRKGRRIAVLGDMLELGDESPRYHREIGEKARECSDEIYTIGDLGKIISSKNHFNTVDELADSLLKNLEQGDVILVKASHSIGLEKLVEILEKN